MRKKLCIVLSVLLTRCNKFVIIFSIGELYLRFVNDFDESESYNKVTFNRSIYL